MLRPRCPKPDPPPLRPMFFFPFLLETLFPTPRCLIFPRDGSPLSLFPPFLPLWTRFWLLCLQKTSSFFRLFSPFLSPMSDLYPGVIPCPPCLSGNSKKWSTFTPIFPFFQVAARRRFSFGRPYIRSRIAPLPLPFSLSLYIQIAQPATGAGQETVRRTFFPSSASVDLSIGLTWFCPVHPVTQN